MFIDFHFSYLQFAYLTIPVFIPSLCINREHGHGINTCIIIDLNYAIYGYIL